jgi:polar amino acid transport system substrate-binding protein
MNVKRILRWSLVLACLLPIFSVLAQDSASTAEPMALPDLGGRTVTVAIENAYPPFNYVDEVSGEAIGWDYDMINEMCARLNCVPEFIQVSWEGMIVAVAGGEYDMAADGISITEERAQQVDYSIPYITTIQRFMVRADETRYDSAQSFIDDPEAQIASQLATTNYELAIGLVGEDRVIGTADFGSAVQSLIAGDVDAVIIDDVAGQGYVGANAESIKLLPDQLSSDPLGFIFPKGSDLVAPIDAALQSMMADQSLARISAFWGLGGPVDDLGTTLMLRATDEINPEFTTLFAAVQAAGIGDMVMDPGQSLTVFAPTDAAFAALPEGTVEMLLADPALLTRILQYHVITPAMGSSEIVSGDVTTASGDTVAVVVGEDGTVTVNGANVLQANIRTTNGIIHVIDTVLLPPDIAEMIGSAPVATEAP